MEINEKCGICKYCGGSLINPLNTMEVYCDTCGFYKK